MGKFKKGNVQQGAKLANPKTNKGPLIAQKKGGQNRVNKINPKKNSIILPENIKEQVKNEKNKKNILEKANLNQVVTVKGPLNKTQKTKLPETSVQNGKLKGDKKQFKNVNPQMKPANNVPASKPQNNKRKAGPEKNLKQQLGPTPKLPVPPSPKNKQKQIPVVQKEPVIKSKVATKGKPKKKLKKQEQKKVESQKEGEIEDETEDLKEAFDEAKFNEIIKEKTIAKIVEALKKNVASEVAQKKNQIFSDFRYILDVTCFKIPYCPTRMVKLNVKHSLIADDDEVCLIVKDLQRGMRVDYEPTVHHYEDLLKKEGAKGIKAIMPFNQLRKEYGSYEMKSKLANTYDYFLCDGSIIGHVVGFLGKTFRNTRCTPHPVRFTTKNLSREIEKALHKTCYKQGAKGCMISIPVAHHKMSTKSVVENILGVISQLKQIYPGGLPNIRNIFMRTNMKGTSSMPLYVSLAAPKKTPFVVGPKEENLKKLKETANKILVQFDVTLAGEILQKRRIEKNNDSVEEPKIKKQKKEKKSGKTEEEAVEEELLKLCKEIGSDVDDVEEGSDEEPKIKKQKKEKKSGKTEEEAVEEELLKLCKEIGVDVDDVEEGSDEEPKIKKQKKEKKSFKTEVEAVGEELFKLCRELGVDVDDDKEGSDEEGSDEDESGEEESDEEESDEEGSEEEENEERIMAEGSDEDESDEDESDEEESGEEEIDALEFDSDDDSTGDIEAASDESDDTEESDEDDDDE